MTSNTKNNNNTTAKVSRKEDRERPKRKTTYQEYRETDIPDEIVEMFKKDGWHLRFLRYYSEGKPDYRYLSKREREGFEFVQLDELPDWYKSAFILEDDRHRKGLLVSGDVVLAKAPLELIEDRRRHINEKTDSYVNAVDINVLKKRDFVDLGSKTKINNKQPNFSE